MRTVILLIACVIWFSTNSYAQTPSGLTILSAATQADVCNEAAYSIQFNTAHPFLLEINAVIRLGSPGGPIVSAYPFPACGNNSNGLNPIIIEILNVDATHVTINPGPPSIGALNQTTYSWIIDHDDPGTGDDVIIDFVVRLDCSLIPQGQNSNPNQSLYLVQTIGPFVGPGNEIITPVGYPYITSPFLVHVDGNYGQTSDMIFEYANIGSAPVSMAFEFNDLFFQNCSGNQVYNPVTVNPITYVVSVSGSIPVSGSFTNNYITGIPFGNIENIPVGYSLFIRRRVKITDCIFACSASREVEFKWQCENMDQPPSCEVCQNGYVTPFVFDLEQPSYEIRVNPSVPLFNNFTCPGEDLQWTVEIQNTSQFTSLLDVNLEFLKNAPEPQGLVNIKETSLTIVQQNSTSTADFINKVTCDPGNLCISLSNPLQSFDFNIPELFAGETVIFSFSTSLCANYDNNPMLFNTDKFFNQWGVTPTAMDKCSTLISPILNHLIVNPIGNGISNHSSNSPGTDMHQITTFSHNGSTDFTVAVPPCFPDPSCQPPPPYFGPVTAPQIVEFGGLFGDANDLQVMGNDGTNNLISGILRAEIFCEKGLIVDPLFTVSITRTGFPVWNQIANSFHQSIPSGSCADGSYFYYFDLGSNPSALEFLNQGVFHFQLQTCCASDGPSDYIVRFSLLMNEDCFVFTPGSGSIPQCNLTTTNNPPCPWLPLNSVGFSVNVHCPGCRAPGIIVDEYRMKRISYGFEDDNNNRIADPGVVHIVSPTPGIPNSGYSEFSQIRRDRSVYGDLLEDRLVAHFEPGSAAMVDPTAYPNDPYYRGYTYTGDMAGMTLGVLQLRRRIQFSEAARMNLVPVSLELFIDQAGTGTHMDWGVENNYFHSSFTPLNYPTIFHQYYDANTSIPLSSVCFKDPVDDQYLFTFNAATLGINFVEGQQYRVVVFYQVCGNSVDDFIPAQNPMNLEMNAGIENEMWLTGGSTSGPYPGGFTLSNHGFIPQMPNVIGSPQNVPVPADDMINTYGIQFQALNTNGTYSNATQANIADSFKFFCETFGGSHTFYSTDANNQTFYRNVPGNVDCEKTISVVMENSIGRKGRHYDVFPYEFRPPSLFFDQLNLVTPADYHLVNNNTAEIFSSYWNYNGALTGITDGQSIPFTVASTTSIHQTMIGPIHFSTLTCFTEGITPTGLVIGDEQSIQTIEMWLEPDCNVSGNSSYFPSSDSQVLFSGNSTGCSVAPASCSIIHTQVNMHGPNRFLHPNPNLQGTLTQNGPVATPRICWDFSFTNYPSATNPDITGLPNLFLAVPVAPDPAAVYLTNWSITSLNYNLTTPLPIPNVTNGIFPLLDTLSATQYAIISGEVCADYTPCQGTGSFEFQWGWNCNGFPNSINDANLCANNVQSTPVTMTDESVNVLVDAAITKWSDDFTQCEPGTYVTACFKNMDPGNTSPITFSINVPVGTPVQIDHVYIINSCQSGQVEILPTPAANTLITLDQSVLTANPLNYINYPGPGGPEAWLPQGACITIKVEFTPLCFFQDPWQLPSVEINFKSYCQSVFPVTATFPSIPKAGAICTDCFMIEKQAGPAIIMQDLQNVQYSIQVCSNNSTSINGSIVSVSDNYPVGFTIAGTDPFSGGPVPFIIGGSMSLPADGCLLTPIQFQGTISTVSSLNCNTATLDYTDANSLPAQLSDTGCVSVIPNCNSNVDLVLNNESASNFPFGLPVIGQSIAINGTFTIDVPSFDFTNKFIKMGPGAEIIVLPGKHLNIKTTYIEACYIMWKGISLHYGAGIDIGKNSYIADAFKAISVSDFNRVVLTETTFGDNFITLYVPAVSPYWNNSTYLINNNIFVGSGVMAPEYTGQFQNSFNGITGLANRPLAAVYAGKTFIDFSDVDVTHQNLFDGLSNGIVGIRSGFLIEQCKFTNIQPEAGYDIGTPASFGVSFNGSGVYAWGYRTPFGLTQTGFGNGVGSINSFNNCHYGLFADNISLNSEYNHMVNVNTAYRAQLIKSDVGINHNRIDANRDAIQFFHNDGGNSAVIWDNDIVFGDSDPIASYTGIRVEEGLLANNDSRINYNRIDFRPGALSARNAIRIFAARDYFITNNVITMTDNNFNRDGILMMGNRAVTASCNAITGSSDYGVYDQSAVRVLTGDGYTIGCNELHSTENGIYIQSTMSLADIKGNEFHDHTYAFHYGQNGDTDQQDFKGNVWNNQVPMNNGWLTWNENPSYFVQQGPWFDVGPGINTYPDFQFQEPPGWFLPLPGNNFICEDTLQQPWEIYCDQFPVDFHGFVTGFDERIATDSIFNNPYTDETRWMLKWSLLEKLQEYPGMLNDSLMNAFYMEMLNTTLTQLKAVDDEMKELYSLDSVVLGSLNQNRWLLEGYRILLNAEMMLLRNAVDSGFNTTPIIDDIYDLLLNRQQLIVALDSLIGGISLSKTNNAVVLNGDNASISAAALIEDNEKQVNEIYLSTIGQDVFVFPSLVKQQLIQIASQCPLAGGVAVLKARALVALFNGQLNYNDRAICWAEGIQLRPQQQITVPKSKAIVYPNPANDRATLVYEMEKEGALRYVIFNSFGAVVNEYVIPEGKTRFEFSTEHLIPGVYYYTLDCTTDRIANGKIMIIR